MAGIRAAITSAIYNFKLHFNQRSLLPSCSIDAGDGAAAAAPTMEQMARLYFEVSGDIGKRVVGYGSYS